MVEFFESLDEFMSTCNHYIKKQSGFCENPCIDGSGYCGHHQKRTRPSVNLGIATFDDMAWHISRILEKAERLELYQILKVPSRMQSYKGLKKALPHLVPLSELKRKLKIGSYRVTVDIHLHFTRVVPDLGSSVTLRDIQMCYGNISGKWFLEEQTHLEAKHQICFVEEKMTKSAIPMGVIIDGAFGGTFDAGETTVDGRTVLVFTPIGEFPPLKELCSGHS